MSERKPLMPKATAVWLVDNTALSFDQIAEFCGLHVLEVKGIADGNVAQGIKGLDPISTGQLTREEIAQGEKEPEHQLRLAAFLIEKAKRGPRYTPVSRRHERPNAVLWLMKNHPELKDSQIMRLVGTTKPTIQQVRDRSHWNSTNLAPQDPVTLGLCSQTDLDAEVDKAAKRLEKSAKGQPEAAEAVTLLPTELTTRPNRPPVDIMEPKTEEPKPETDREEAARVFAKLQELSSGADTDEDVNEKTGE